MRIGIDARPLISSTPSGIGNYLRNIISYINSIDTINEYFLYTNKIFECNYTWGSNIKIKVVPGKVGTFWLRYILPSHIDKDKIDVFWGTQHFLPLKRRGVKYVLTVHDLALIINPRWGKTFNSIVQNVYLGRSLKNADKIIAISNSTKKDIEKIYKIPNGKIDVVYNGGLSLGLTNTCINKDKKYNSNEPFFLYIGTVEPRKNIENLIKGFNQFAHQNNSVNLVIAGGLGWKYKNILKQIEASPFKERIYLIGYVTDAEKIDLYKNAIAFVFLSHHEGFGIPILEAYSNGCLVVTASNSSLKEVGGNGAIYVNNENDTGEISKALYKAYTICDDEKSLLLGEAVSQLNVFKWEKCAEETLNIIRGVYEN